jgi:hypothetical protein
VSDCVLRLPNRLGMTAAGDDCWDLLVPLACCCC